MKKQTKESISEFFLGLRMAIGFALIIFGIYLFFVGFHNIDLSVNMLKISYDKGLNFYGMRDTTISGTVIDYSTGYILGCRQMLLAFFITLFGALLYGINLAKFEEKYKCHKKVS